MAANLLGQIVTGAAAKYFNFGFHGHPTAVKIKVSFERLMYGKNPRISSDKAVE
jgi:hypothetical protein